MRSEHIPQGDPCSLCGLPSLKHRVNHTFIGNDSSECKRCRLPVECHRLRVDTRTRAGRVQTRKDDKLFIGLDGEGQGRIRHNYVLLAASDESGERTWYVHNEEGLTTVECLEFLETLPIRARNFTYSFGYDLTKILQCLTKTPDGRRALYLLFRPELRQRMGPDSFKGPYPVFWKDWQFNLQGTKFSFGRIGQRRRIIWDVWKFYQSKFVKALELWKVGSPEDWLRIKKMKDKRHILDQESFENILKYCLSECRYMAQLARRLIEAHEKAGIGKLKSFYGAGSTSSLMLEQMKVRQHIAPPPDEMKIPVAQAFSGGRFDGAWLGMFRQKVYGRDISSAYPYQTYQLPCLTHARWEKTRRRKDIEKVRHALIHYSLKEGVSDITHWGPFPFRDKGGSICYPAVSGGGWVWKAEYLMGEKYWANVGFIEAWLLIEECECHPFSKMPHYYNERVKLGKEGPGIVLKLGSNSVYGKLAQSVGKGRFNSWVWAGMVTSGCRAQGLEAIGLHDDERNLLMIATDGILSLEDIQLPAPMDTGTAETKKPLGGWESKDEPEGVFIARAGVYFPISVVDAIDNENESDEVERKRKEYEDKVRGRGVGRGVVLDNASKIINAWDMWDGHGNWPTVVVDKVSRFCGAKSSVSRRGKPGYFEYACAEGNHLAGEPRYGEWISRKVSMSFNPMPKRDGLAEDGSLKVRRLPQDEESQPYRNALKSPEARELAQLAIEISEQPDLDFGEYDLAVE